MEDYLIVDGYNVINSWEDLKKIKDDSLDHARDKLIDIVANYAGLYGVQATIVFDAYQVKGGVEKQELMNGILVIYSKEGETADTVIEKFVGQLPQKGIVCVVTSDWVEQQIILGKGAVRLSAREFWHRIQEYQKKTAQIGQEQPTARRHLDQLVGEKVRDKLEKWRREK